MDSNDSISDLTPISIEGSVDITPDENLEAMDEGVVAVSAASDESDVEDSSVEESDVEESDDDDVGVNEEGEMMDSSLENEQVSTVGISMKSVLDSDDDDTTDDDSDSEDEYKKFDESVKTNLIEDYHKELKQINYDEITALTKIVRDENGNIIDPIHKTLPFLTKFERARILGVRAKQINNGAEPFIDVPENVIEGHVIAEMELERKAIPFIIARPLPNGKKEYWNASDLELIDY